jgi:hypothetical protein
VTPFAAALAARFDAEAARDLALATRRARELLLRGDWVADLLAPMAARIAIDPAYEPPMKVARGGGRVAAVLFDGPAARITASVAVPQPDAPVPATAIASGHVSVTRYVRAGGARLLRWRTGSAGPAQPMRTPSLRDGDVVVHDGRHAAQVALAGAAPTVTIAVQLRAAAGPLMREYAVADGRLLRSATTDDGASRTAMLLTLLRVTGRRDAGEQFAAATLAADRHHRWQAMREWLALDAAAALPRLVEMAQRDAHPDVRAAASVMRDRVEQRMSACRG